MKKSRGRVARRISLLWRQIKRIIDKCRLRSSGGTSIASSRGDNQPP